MAMNLINVGSSPNKGDGDSLRTSFIKINNNFTEVYNSLSALSGGAGGELQLDIRGSVKTLGGTVLLDATTGKLTLDAVPLNVPLVFNFTASFDNSGSLNTITDLPDGWSYSKSSNIASISHTVGRPPSTISYWGHTLTDGDRLRFPTAGYQVKTGITPPYTFSLNLNSAVTGADNGQYARISVIF